MTIFEYLEKKGYLKETSFGTYKIFKEVLLKYEKNIIRDQFGHFVETNEVTKKIEVKDPVLIFKEIKLFKEYGFYDVDESYDPDERLQINALKRKGVKVVYEKVTPGKSRSALASDNYYYGCTYYKCTLNGISITVIYNHYSDMVDKFFEEYNKILEKFKWENMEA